MNFDLLVFEQRILKDPVTGLRPNLVYGRLESSGPHAPVPQAQQHRLHTPRLLQIRRQQLLAKAPARARPVLRPRNPDTHRTHTRQHLPLRQVAAQNHRASTLRVTVGRIPFQKGLQLRFSRLADDSLRPSRTSSLNSSRRAGFRKGIVVSSHGVASLVC